MPEASDWIETASKLWELIAAVLSSIVIGASYVIGVFSKVNRSDKEVVKLLATAENHTKTLSNAESRLDILERQYADLCRDTRDSRDRADKNTSNIDYILGRMDFGTRQRKDPNEKR